MTTSEMIHIDQGSSETLEVQFVNSTGTALPSDLTATMTIKFPTPLTLTPVTVTDLKASFSLTPAQTNVKLSSYRFKIKLANASESFVKYISGEILIKDPYDD